jgi:hypothetical protein
MSGGSSMPEERFGRVRALRADPPCSPPRVPVQRMSEASAIVDQAYE